MFSFCKTRNFYEKRPLALLLKNTRIQTTTFTKRCSQDKIIKITHRSILDESWYIEIINIVPLVLHLFIIMLPVRFEWWYNQYN